jgi:hypothetical protein
MAPVSIEKVARLGRPSRVHLGLRIVGEFRFQETPHQLAACVPVALALFEDVTDLDVEI